MSKKFMLTKEDFIERSMDGDEFMFEKRRYFYDEDEGINPFRVGDSGLDTSWNIFNGENLFELVEETELRYRYRKDTNKMTVFSEGYMTDESAEEYGYTKDEWYKAEDDFIEVRKWKAYKTSTETTWMRG